ncbi:hypothetical protein AMATHDRAFT_7849 [Amanita thiersii Skay4041]|uniref:Uncharacterized protein n=1 Tax=Amanita thiersii Skay4041 TaxID=703135 RepID=A0A2A9NDT3_9AGAR|nr:hypothetical protein AMATHDRAFT_7849 [Amanita thiersii Skay4041]
MTDFLAITEIMSATMPPMSGLPHVPPNIALFSGPLLVGVFFNFILYGILVSQSFASVFLLETIQVACTEMDIFYWFGSAYGNVLKPDDSHISPIDTPLINSVIALTVQVFFCYHIWKINKGYWPICADLCAHCAVRIASITGGIGACVQGFGRRFSEARDSNLNEYLWLAGAAIADVVIAVTMTYLLCGAKNEASQTSHYIARITIQTCSLTDIFVITLILDLIVKDAPLFVVPDFRITTEQLRTNEASSVIELQNSGMKQNYC